MGRLFFCALVIVSLTAPGQSIREAHDGPALTWTDSSHDFGDIQQGEKVEYTFEFKNTGNQPLIITNVATQCGCTTPKGWPRDPVMPGEEGKITIAFDSSGKIGRQNKVITIISNAADGKSNQVVLSGNVTEKSP
jgi:hypothetical protein